MSQMMNFNRPALQTDHFPKKKKTNAGSPNRLEINLLPFSTALVEKPSSVVVRTVISKCQPTTSKAGLLSAPPLPNKEKKYWYVSTVYKRAFHSRADSSAIQH